MAIEEKTKYKENIKTYWEIYKNRMARNVPIGIPQSVQFVMVRGVAIDWLGASRSISIGMVQTIPIGRVRPATIPATKLSNKP